jgi:hypothetical protein
MTEKTMTDEDYDLAVGAVASFYQSRRALLKKQVTHWIGKFMICKAENNALRKKNRMLYDAMTHHRSMEARNGIEITKLREESSSNVSKLAGLIRSHENTIAALEAQVKELEAGILV